MRIITLAIVIALLVPGTANAGAYFRTEDGKSAVKYNKWMRAAKVAEPDAVVTVRAWQSIPMCTPGAQACQDWDNGIERIEMRIQNARSMQLAFWHEVGHVFDGVMFTDRHRSAYLSILGRPNDPWAWADYQTSPHEMFARAYAACALLGPQIPYGAASIGMGELNYFATRRQHALTCKLIEGAAHGQA